MTEPAIEFSQGLLEESQYPNDYTGNYDLVTGPTLYFWSDGVVTWKDHR